MKYIRGVGVRVREERGARGPGGGGVLFITIHSLPAIVVTRTRRHSRFLYASSAISLSSFSVESRPLLARLVASRRRGARGQALCPGVHWSEIFSTDIPLLCSCPLPFLPGWEPWTDGCAHTRWRIFMCIYVYVCIYIYMYIFIHIYIHVNICIGMHMYVSVCTL